MTISSNIMVSAKERFFPSTKIKTYSHQIHNGNLSSTTLVKTIYFVFMSHLDNKKGLVKVEPICLSNHNTWNNGDFESLIEDRFLAAFICSKDGTWNIRVLQDTGEYLKNITTFSIESGDKKIKIINFKIFATKPCNFKYEVHAYQRFKYQCKLTLTPST